MMMSKMMMIVLMIPTIDKTDRQYQQHLTTPTTHHIVEHEHDFIAFILHRIQFNKKFILFIQFIYN